MKEFCLPISKSIAAIFLTALVFVDALCHPGVDKTQKEQSQSAGARLVASDGGAVMGGGMAHSGLKSKRAPDLSGALDFGVSARQVSSPIGGSEPERKEGP